MKKIQETYENEIIINKSRFITHLYRVNTIEEINNILILNNKKYYDATHNCYGYILGTNQDIQKCSDDGEPSKTAGYPILDVLKKNDMTNILCIVTRYFGGILLGAGGLVRAYSSSASEALNNAHFFIDSYLQKLLVTISYSHYNTLLSYFQKFMIINQEFSTDVTLTLGVNKNDCDDFSIYITNATSGNVLIEVLEEFNVEVPCDI